MESLEPRFTPAGDVIALTLQVVNDSGTPLASVAPGQDFKVQVFVQDLRDDYFAKGVFSAFTDILFDADVIEPIGDAPITFGQDYQAAPTGDTNTAGVVDELGGLATNGFSNLDSQPHLLAEVQFHAKRFGNPNLRLDPPDKSVSDILLFESVPVDEVPVDEISFGNSRFVVDKVTRRADGSPIDVKPRVSSGTTQSPVDDIALASTQLLPGTLNHLTRFQPESGFVLASLDTESSIVQDQSSEARFVEQNSAYFMTDFDDTLVAYDDLMQASRHAAVHTDSVSAQSLSFDSATIVSLFKNLNRSSSLRVELQDGENRREIEPTEAATDHVFAELDSECFPILEVRLSRCHSVIC